MKRYSSTIIRYFNNHCPAALGFYERGFSDEADRYQIGVACHAVLQEVGEKNAQGEQAQKIAENVAQRMITSGRSYYDELKPPMKPEFAFAGRDLALQYLQSNPLPWPAKFEIVLAMNDKGKPCANGEHRYRAIIDCVYEETHGDEEYAADLICVRDYKSAWPTDESELETLQRKGQAVLAWLHYPNKQGVRTEVVNLRTGKVFDRVIYFDDEGTALLKQWRKDILATCRAADKTRKARPGAGCIDCPFFDHCPDAQKVADSKSNVAALAVLEERRKSLIRKLKIQLAETDGVKIAGGFIGYKNQPENVLADNAIYNLMQEWYGEPIEKLQETRGDVVGLLMTLGIGSGQIKTFAKKKFAGEHKVNVEAFEEICLRKEPNVKFGVWQDKDSSGLKLIKKSELKKAKAPKKIKKAA